jgi:VWFA-related protein
LVNSVFLIRHTLVLLVIVGFAATSAAQTPTPSPSPAQKEETVKVFTEEVRLPVQALDAYGHYDPTLELDDVLVLEDGVIQQLRSVTHVPANVLFILDTGGEVSGLGGMSKSTNLTRQVAAELIGKLQQGAWISVMQSGNGPEMVQQWTTDKQAVYKTLKNKLLSTKRARISEAIATAGQQFKDRPEGSRHVVLITDGVDSPGVKVSSQEAVKNLIAVRATVHVISYTQFVRQKMDKTKSGAVAAGPRPRSSDPISATDPTMPPGVNRSPSFGMAIRFDPAMSKQRKAYESQVKKSEFVLKNIADETGGKLMLPLSSDQMLAQAVEVARAIGSEYVVTYRPKRPLAEATPGEYRRIQVASRRVGLSLHSRRGYVVPTVQP